MRDGVALQPQGMLLVEDPAVPEGRPANVQDLSRPVQRGRRSHSFASCSSHFRSSPTAFSHTARLPGQVSLLVHQGRGVPAAPVPVPCLPVPAPSVPIVPSASACYMVPDHMSPPQGGHLHGPYNGNSPSNACLLLVTTHVSCLPGLCFFVFSFCISRM